MLWHDPKSQGKNHVIELETILGIVSPNLGWS